MLFKKSKSRFRKKLAEDAKSGTPPKGQQKGF